MPAYFSSNFHMRTFDKNTKDVFLLYVVRYVSHDAQLSGRALDSYHEIRGSNLILADNKFAAEKSQPQYHRVIVQSVRLLPP